MNEEFSIQEVRGLEILDSRGNPTLRTCVETAISKGCADAPAGASKGTSEALELRDGGKRLSGKGTRKAVFTVENIIAPAIAGLDVRDQQKIDSTLIKLDGTEQKSRLGSNTMLTVSLAVARAAAGGLGLPLYRYLGGISPSYMPVPLLNIINGGAHAGNKLEFQEFIVAPIGADNFTDALWVGVEIYHALKEVIVGRFGKQYAAVGDEGGFAPPIEDPREALNLLVKAVESAGYALETDVVLAVDVAASQLYDSEKAVYVFMGREWSTESLVEYYTGLADEYPIRLIEDPLWESDFKGFAELQRTLARRRVIVVGDDLYTTNVSRLMQGVLNESTRGVIVKPNQVGTLTETMEFVELAKRKEQKIVVSHRSGDTEDSFIADLSIAVQSDFIKTGAPARGERTCKYNRLLEIDGELRGTIRFRGRHAFD
uniref:Enolase n=1 Tax=Fervidicoccus fontis TaxID=683846 RepID=A0A7J3ZK75_9CREN